MPRQRGPKRHASRSASTPDAPSLPSIAVRERAAPTSTRLQRLARIIVLGAAGGLGGAILPALPELIRATPIEIYWFVNRPVWRVLAIAIFLVLGPARLAAAIPRALREHPARWARRGLPSPLRAAAAFATGVARAIAAPLAGTSRLEIFAARVLEGPATAVTATAATLLLLAWIPHYLTWPWWPDVDQFAVSAQSWSAGIIPYRDQIDFDFPGPIYLHFVLGKIFGWGATVAFHAMDAAFVVVLGCALAGWSRRLFGSALPGLVSYLAFLGQYLSFDYSLAAQRDWHASLLVVLSLVALQAWPGKRGHLVSALAFGSSFAFRPHEIVFLPAMAAAIDEGARAAGAPWRRTIRPSLAWSGLLALATLLAFSPLILAGVLDNLIRRVHTAMQGPYNVRSDYTFQQGVLRYLHDPATMLLVGATVLLAIGGPTELRRPARTWALALLGAFFYKPLSPWPHSYLDQPIALVRAINLALLVAWLQKTQRVAAWVRLASLALILWACVPGIPRFCTATGSLRALGPLCRGEDPLDAPPGCGTQFGRLVGPGEWYRWDDYRPLLAYLRESTAPGTRIADLLWNVPYPPVNGPAGRLTPFPAAGGYIHLWMVDRSLSAEYVAVLEQNTDLLVVWGPGKENPFFPELDRAVRASYVPIARFGAIEVWRHRDRDESKTAGGKAAAGSG